MRGWKCEASATRDLSEFETLFADLDPASRALLLSQGGPHGGRAFTVLLTSPEFTFQGAHFRVLLLCRLRKELPAVPHRCRCGCHVDPLGDHRAACPTTGVLCPRGVPLERATVRLRCEAGVWVATNVQLAQMKIDVPINDDCNIEVVANGFPL